MQPLNQNYVDISVSNQKVPCDGPKSFHLRIPFDQVDAWSVDLTLTVQQGRVEEIQGIYVDTHDLADDLIIRMPRTQQRVIIPAQKQGYIPLLIAEPFVLEFSSQAANGSIAYVQLLNVPMPAYLWDTV